MNFINKYTSLFISVAQIPGNNGNRFFNFFFHQKKINSIYFSRKITHLKNLKNTIIQLNISGCSISMPFKDKACDLLDFKSKDVLLTKSVNTIINKNNKLYGFNTDYHSLKNKINELKINPQDTIKILGSGSMAYNSFLALSKINKNIYICSRKKPIGKKWINKKFKYLSWNKRKKINATVLINATSIGMKKASKNFFSKHDLCGLRGILDVVIDSRSNLQSLAKNLNIKYITGNELNLMQATKQFYLYTGFRLSQNDLRKYNNFIKKKLYYL